MIEKKDFQYKLLDCGNRRRIEKFGTIIVDRPFPQATWKLKRPPQPADTIFQTDTKWKPTFTTPWLIKIGKMKVQLQFSENGQIGIFPEQFENWQWIEEKIKKHSSRHLKILNTFAYTGIATLFASHKNTEVCHVDGSKSAINCAKKNVKLSKPTNSKIRWICDDVISFMEREVRRGKKYDGIILDPPAFGKGAKKYWKIEKDLPDLMQLVEQLLKDKPLFVILTCHAPKHFSAQDFAQILENLKPFRGKKAETLNLTIPSRRGNALPSSFGARICL